MARVGGAPPYSAREDALADVYLMLTSCAGGRHNMPPPPASRLLTLKVVSESRVTWVTSVPILVFLGLSVLDLGPMYATNRRQTSERQTDGRQTLIIA